LAIKNRSNLYLYLALICFAGILAIFVVDGYLGVYDTAYITFGEREQTIEAYSWQEPWVKEQGYSMGTSWGETVYFKYKIDNRAFSTYEADVEASVWKSGVKIMQLLDERVSVAPFKAITVDWKLRAEDLGEAGLAAGESGEYTVRIGFGEVERRIVISYYAPVPGYPEKGSLQPVPVPVPEPAR
jgi:hypothetical protein